MLPTEEQFDFDLQKSLKNPSSQIKVFGRDQYGYNGTAYYKFIVIDGKEFRRNFYEAGIPQKIPESFVAFDKESKSILSKDIPWLTTQNHLYVSDKGIYIRHLVGKPKKNVMVSSLGEIDFRNQRDLDKEKIDEIVVSAVSDFITNQKYFLNDDFKATWEYIIWDNHDNLMRIDDALKKNGDYT